MQDGIIKGTGNSRYLKSVANFLSLYPTYEAFAAALIAGELPIDLNGINEAGWQQLATALNKANLLSDETAAALGDVNTPDEAFMALVDKAGTIRLTMRTDLGDKWLLANGAIIDRTEYPQLSQLIPATLERPWENVSLDRPSEIRGIAYINGYYIAYGSFWDADDETAAGLCYSTSLEGPWTTVITWKYQGSSTNNRIFRIIYANGYYVAVGSGHGINPTGKIAYSESLDGPWTAVNINGQGGHYITDVIYVNDTYIAVGYMSAAINICYATDVRYWTGVLAYQHNYAIQGFPCLIYEDGMYYILAGLSTGGSNYVGYCLGSSSYTSTFTYKYGLAGIPTRFIRINDQDVILTYVRTGAPRVAKASVKTSLSTPTETAKALWQTDGSYDEIPHDLIYANGYYIAVGQHWDGNSYVGRLAYASSLDGPWTYVDFDTTDNQQVLMGVMSSGNDIAVVGTIYSNSGTEHMNLWKANNMVLPEISLTDDAYTYIKAKE